MSVKSKDIKIGDTIGDLIIRSEMEPPRESDDQSESFKYRLFMCSCACGNIVQKLDTELECFPTFRQCNDCLYAQKEAKDLWGQFLDIFTQQDQLERDKPEVKGETEPLPFVGTALFQVFKMAEPRSFDAFSRTLTLYLNSYGDASLKSNLKQYPNEFLEKNQHRWLPIAQKLNFSIKFIYASSHGPSWENMFPRKKRHANKKAH